MKIILLKDVAGVGQKHDVKDVTAGYAQNFLIVKGLAEVATPKKMASAEKLQKERAEELEKSQGLLKAALESLGSKPLVLKAKANEQGHLFEGVHEAKIAELLSEKVGTAVPANAISLKSPIKEIGVHTVRVKTPQWEGGVLLEVKGA